MTRKFLIDNNIWAGHEKDYQPIVGFINKILADEDDIYSTRIIQMELLSFSEIETNNTIRDNRKGYLLLCDEILEVDEQMILKAAEIRRKAKLAGRSAPKGPDAMIAAAAILHKLTLVSNNDRDFNWVQSKYELKYENPVIDKPGYKAFCDKYEEDKKKGLKVDYE